MGEQPTWQEQETDLMVTIQDTVENIPPNLFIFYMVIALDESLTMKIISI